MAKRGYGEPNYYRYQEEEHDLILIEHSKTFCKLIMINNENGTNCEYKKSPLFFINLKWRL